MIGSDITQLVLGFLNDGTSIQGWNETFLVTILKMKHPQKVSQSCLISLCNVSYKLISKILTRYLSEVVDEAQSAFVLDHFITDNAILGFEAFHSMKEGRPFLFEDYMALKLDMMKAYDHVKWDYLKWIMQRMAYLIALINRIMTCVTFVRFQIC